jgi:hypothetical protein
LKFVGDETNTTYKQFDIFNNMRTIRYLGNNVHSTFNHQTVLPNTGVFMFKVKIIKSASKYIFIGACGKDIKSAINANSYHHNLFMGLYLNNGSLYGKGGNRVVTSPITIVEGKSIIKTIIDMTRKNISWYLDDDLLYGSSFWKEMYNVEIYPFVNLYTNGDTVEFINQ